MVTCTTHQLCSPIWCTADAAIAASVRLFASATACCPGGHMSLIHLRFRLTSHLSPSASSVKRRYFCDKSKNIKNAEEKSSLVKQEAVDTADLTTSRPPSSTVEIIEKVKKIMPPEDDYRKRYFDDLDDSGLAKAKDLIRMDVEWFSDEEKSRGKFIEKAELFKKSVTKNRMGHSEFVYAALRVMKEYGVHRDLEAYRALIDVFPKGVMVPRNLFQASLFHYYKQQDTVISVITQMEENSVLIDSEIERLVIDLFGKNSYAWRKVARNLYWTSKFINANPFPLPENLNDLDPLELAMIALRRMCPDVTTKIKAYSTAQVDGSLDKTWIASAQSPHQCDLIDELDADVPVYIEGPLKVWLAHHSISYFMLTADVKKVKDNAVLDENDIARLPLNLYGKSKKDALFAPKSIHIQEDGIVLALAASGTSSRDSLLSWVRILEQLTPAMKNRQVVFKIQAPITQVEPQSPDRASNSTQ